MDFSAADCPLGLLRNLEHILASGVKALAFHRHPVFFVWETVTQLFPPFSSLKFSPAPLFHPLSFTHSLVAETLPCGPLPSSAAPGTEFPGLVH